MFLEICPNRGHDYWVVARAFRDGSRVRNRTELYLGRLDILTSEKRTALERKVLALHDDQLLHAFYAQLARHGHPVPRPTLPGVVEDGPFPLPPVDFPTLTDALRQDDLTSRDLAAFVSRIGLPVRAEELVAVGVRVEAGRKTARSISLFYRATSPHRPPAVRRATGNSRSRRRSDGRSKPSAAP